MLKKSLYILPVLLIASCAYVVDKSYQQLTIRTPGAKNSECDVYADKVRYKFYPPETRNIKNSPDDLVIECMAPGNRDRRVVFESNISKYTSASLVTGFVPGVLWDYASESAFTYPSVVTIDFRNMPPRPSPLPAHNYEDTLQPDNFDLEEFRPGAPRLNSDKYEIRIPLIKRGEAGDGFSSSSVSGDSDAATYTGPYQDKADLMKVIQSTGAGSDSAPATPSDGPMYPGN